MPNIVINEIDLTTPGVAAESTDVVYIPGFVNIDQDCLYEMIEQDDGTKVRGSYQGLAQNKPQLFTSVSQFISKCGKVAPTFASDQSYAGLKFAAHAVSGVSNMFKEGDVDPSYVMAKELLSAGISVLYERVNGNDTKSEVKYLLISDTDPSVSGLIGKSATADSEFYYEDKGEYFPYSEPLFPANNGTAAKPDYNVWEMTAIKLADITEEEWNKDIGNIKAYNTYYILDDGKYSQLVSKVGSTDFNEENATNYPTVYTFNMVDSPVSNWGVNYTKYCKKVGNDLIAYTAEDIEYRKYASKNIYRNESIDSISAVNMYTALAGIYDTSNLSGIVDRGNYSVKYLTSGGYPVFEYDDGSLVTKMLAMAEKRGDCVALIDHTDNDSRTIDPNAGKNSVYDAVQKAKDSFSNGDFGAMFTPWATYNRATSDEDIKAKKVSKPFRAPGSFAYLAALADSIKTNANWLAIAGAARGGVRNLAANGMTTVIPNGVADAMQPRTNAVAVNAITNINPYGLTIWGNRTLKPIEDNLVATSFLNVRNLVSDIKKTCYRAARKATFEQDTDILWINFTSEIAKLLDRMKSGYGISGYKIVRDNDHEKAAENATLCAKIIIYPTYAVEDFYITVVLQDDEVTVQ